MTPRQRRATLIGRVGTGGILLCTSACLWFVIPQTFEGVAFLFGQPFHQTELDPAATLLKKTGLALPTSAKIEHFDYQMGTDDIMTLRFLLPKVGALSFISQKKLSGWKRYTVPPSYPSIGWNEIQKPPYREAQVGLPDGKFMNLIVEEKPSGPWRVWVEWNET
jgi:hypothetical protein